MMSNNRAAAGGTTPASPQPANGITSLLKEVSKDAVQRGGSHRKLRPLPPHRNLRKVLFKKHFEEAEKEGGKSTALFKLTDDDLRKRFNEWDVDNNHHIDHDHNYDPNYHIYNPNYHICYPNYHIYYGYDHEHNYDLSYYTSIKHHQFINFHQYQY